MGIEIVSGVFKKEGSCRRKGVNKETEVRKMGVKLVTFPSDSSSGCGEDRHASSTKSYPIKNTNTHILKL